MPQLIEYSICVMRAFDSEISPYPVKIHNYGPVVAKL